MLKNFTTLLLVSFCCSVGHTQPSTPSTLPFSVNAGSDKVICPGGYATLNAAASGGTTPYVFDWSPVAGLSNTSIRNPLVHPAQNTDYIVTVTDSTGLIARDTVRVTLDSNIYRPVISIVGGSNPFCEGSTLDLMAGPASTFLWSTGSINSFVILSHTDTVTVRAVRNDGCIGISLPFIATMKPRPAPPVISYSGIPSVCNGSLTLNASHADPVSFNWNTGDTGSSITINDPGYYSLTATDANGCTSLPAGQVVTGLPVGDVLSSGNQTFCAGDSIQIFVSTDPSNSVTWSNGSTDLSQWVSAPGDYTATLTSPEGCTNDAGNMVTITVLQPPPPPVISSNGPAGFCYGDSITLHALHGQNDVQFMWNTGDDADSVRVGSAGDYSVRVADAQGCWSDADTMSVTVFPLATGTIVTSAPSTFCQGDSIALSIQSPNAVQYLWNNGSTASGIWVKTAGNFDAQLVTDKGCTGHTDNVVSTSIKPLPFGQILQKGNLLELNTDATGYSWYFGGQVADSGHLFLDIEKGGVYSVKMSRQGCTAWASAPAILHKGTQLSWQVYPNPVTNALHITYTLLQKEKAVLELHDAAGRVLMVLASEEQPAGEHGYTIPSMRSRFSPGVYFITLSVGGKQETGQVILR